MIITESGVVVGKLNDETLELEDVRSDRLRQLIDGWRQSGFEQLAPAEIPDDLDPRPVCATTVVVIPFTADNLGVIENKLLIAGFDVQPG